MGLSQIYSVVAKIGSFDQLEIICCVLFCEQGPFAILVTKNSLGVKEKYTVGPRASEYIYLLSITCLCDYIS